MLPLCLANASTGAPGALDALLESVGRLHILAVHLPIGMVLGALAVEGVRGFQRRTEACSFTAIACWIAAVGAIGACVTGWIFAESEGSGNDLFWHRWLGIATAAVLVGVAWMATRALAPGRGAGQIVPVVRMGVLVCAGLTAWVGHLGGNMAWGKNFVMQPLAKYLGGAEARRERAQAAEGAGGGSSAATAPREPGEPVSAGAVALYREQILPLFENRCYECHGRGKHKGGLALDDPESTVAQNTDGDWIVKPGNIHESTLIARVLLPESDDEAMPPEGPRLTATQLDALRAWIEGGAPMDAPAGGAEGATDAATPGAGPSAAPTPTAPTPPTVAAPSAQLLAQAAALQPRGWRVTPIAADAARWEAAALPGSGVGDAELALLAPFAAGIEELNLARTAITDAGAAAAPAFPQVRRLRASRTALTDAGLAALLQRTPSAEVVILSETAATDALFGPLEQLPSLRRVFVWHTRMTSDGIDAFRARRPSVEVVVGATLAGTSDAAGPPPTP
ncbi:MAG: c-type cytochrome domain-containing protein [Phycisphaerales bacterium]